MKTMTAITAMGRNGEIGKDNKLLCQLKDDMSLFKFLTNKTIVVMGRKTFESIGKPLEGRINVILTSNREELSKKHPNCLFLSSIDEVLDFCVLQERNSFIIGGSQIYEQFLPYCNELIISKIDASFDNADSYFPEIDWDEWDTPDKLTGGLHYEKNESNEHSFTIYLYKRKLNEVVRQ